MNRSVPFFSIILPTFNRPDLLVHAIQSIRDQTFANWELIIIDDGSEAETGVVAREQTAQDERIRYSYQQNQGRGGVRNAGIERAIGPYITFLDDDDYYLPQHLQSIYELIERLDYPLGLIRSEAYYKIDGQLRPVEMMPVERKPGIKYLWMHGASPMFFTFHRRLFDQYVFDSRFSIGQDHHLIMRLALNFPVFSTLVRTLVLVEHPQRASNIRSREQLEIAAASRLGVYQDLMDNHQAALQKYLSEKGMRKRKSIDLLYISGQAMRTKNYRLGLQYLVRALMHYTDMALFIKSIKIVGRAIFRHFFPGP